jgi:hypothetical protein
LRIAGGIVLGLVIFSLLPQLIEAALGLLLVAGAIKPNAGGWSSLGSPGAGYAGRGWRGGRV